MPLEQVDVRGVAPERLEPFIGAERTAAFATTAGQARALLEGRVVLNVNSTASGGGVAELLQTLLAYARGAGVDARWAVIKGDPRFFEITKRIHNHLYGTPGDGGPLGAAEHHDYEETTRRNADEVAAIVRTDDVVVLHDPQTAALAPAFHRGRARRLALSHRSRRPQRVLRTRVELPPAISSGSGRLRRLMRPLRAGVGTTGSTHGDRAVDRPLLGEERAHRTG